MVFAARLTGRLGAVPAWWEPFVAWVAQRRSPRRAIEVIGAVGAQVAAGVSTPAELLGMLAVKGSRSVGAAARCLDSFFATTGLARGLHDEALRVQARLARIVASTPEVFRGGASGYLAAQLESRDKARRSRTRPLADATVELRLRVIRDLGCFLDASRPALQGWEAVSGADVEAFLAAKPKLRALRLGALRSFFAWARSRRLVLVSPVRQLRCGQRQAFVGAVAEEDLQRELYRRWSTDEVHPHEAFAGLMALIHAASRAELRTLRVADVDRARHRVRLGERPLPVPLDPVTWTALAACLALRESRGSFNPHVLVTRITAGRDCPVSSSYLTHVLDPAGVSLQSLRSTRLASIVTAMDPKLVSEAFGLHLAAPLYYLADSVDDARLTNM